MTVNFLDFKFFHRTIAEYNSLPNIIDIFLYIITFFFNTEFYLVDIPHSGEPDVIRKNKGTDAA